MTKPSSKFEPGVQKFLNNEEHNEIQEEYKSTLKNLGYKKSRVRFPEQVLPPTTLPISNDIWKDKLKMEKLNFVDLATNEGLVKEGRIIVEGTSTITTIVKLLVSLMLINLNQVRIIIKGEINPKAKISLKDDKFYFSSDIFKQFLIYYFPQDIELIKMVNASDIMKSLLIGLENNPVRGKRNLGVLVELSTKLPDAKKSRKSYVLDNIITKLSKEQFDRLVCIFIKKPHYTIGEWVKLKHSVLNPVAVAPIKKEIIPPVVEEIQDLITASDNKEDVLSVDLDNYVEEERGTDESLPPAIEVNPTNYSEKEISVDQVINLKALKKILGRGDSITITIQYIKSSGE